VWQCPERRGKRHLSCCLFVWRIFLTMKPLSLAKCCPKKVFSTNNLITFEQLKHFHEIIKWVKLSTLQYRTPKVCTISRLLKNIRKIFNISKTYFYCCY
jgi:hypothetical protein